MPDDGFSDVDIAWIAGLLEGEGCFSICTRKTSKHDHKSLAIHCEMTDEDTIEKLHRVTKCGTINVRKNTSGRRDDRNRKQTWIWSVQNHAGIYKVCCAIYPHMSKRRQEKIKELIEYVESRISLDHA